MWVFPNNTTLEKYLGRVYMHVTRRLFTDWSTFTVYQLRLSNTNNFDYSTSLDTSFALAPKKGQLPGRDVRHHFSTLFMLGLK